MKKYLGILVIALILLTGCGEKETIKICKSTNEDTINGYRLDAEYKIYSKGDIVEKVEIKEVVISESQELLDYFEAYLQNTYSSINEAFGGYENKVTKENLKVTSNTTINYNEMDIAKFVKENKESKNFINNDNKVLLESLINSYEKLGAICK
ncbi:MAG: DUF1307 domain-containing protein [Bacilli bacterium]|nr:DUF1307 domain-containing protein [Bacilli bacterium]